MGNKNGYINFEVVVTPEDGKKSIFDPNAFPGISNLDLFTPPIDKNIEVAQKLQRNGIEIHHIGEFSISASCTKKKFESFFNTEVNKIQLPKDANIPDDYEMFAPDKSSPWKLPSEDSLDTLIDRAYVQHDPILFADERPLPPLWTDEFRLRVPVDVAQILRASSVHKRGYTGKGVKVVMADTGFYHHPYFKEQGYNFMAITAPDTLDHSSDSHGHGTGECANLFATAPGINFVGVKMGNPTLAIKTATELKPDIISNSWGYSVDGPLPEMPNWLKPLYMAVLSAVKRGITIVFSAGNGHYGFPGSMPEVISVGGVVVDSDLEYSATNYTSGFKSRWFPGRNVPDVSGLCGVRPRADYIVLPVQKGAVLEIADGWGAFSGTSAAAPMVAGVCALIKEAKPEYSSADIKNTLKFTARDIIKGVNAHNQEARPGPDLATGFGLVDAARAIENLI
ncbi:MAG: S8 family serine peptidase [Desulfocapsaceae bacterium]|nr:S8 family serine peptidase [Desulfocapsaceae bacterium]